MLSFGLGCTKVNEKEIVSDKEKERETIKEKLACMGFGAKDFKMLNDSIVQVYDDLLIDKRAILYGQRKITKVPNSTQPRSIVVNPIGIVSHSFVQNIYYWIDPEVRNATYAHTWEQAIVDATSDWSNISGSAVRFTRINQNDLPLIQWAFGQLVIFTTNRKDEPQWKDPICSVMPANPSDAISWVAQAFFPAEYIWEPGNVKAGSMVVINDYNSLASTNPDKMRETMKHEIGHSLGFRHSNSLNPTSLVQIENDITANCDGTFTTGRNVVCGTPQLDLASIMSSSPQNPDVAGDFTSNDIRAIRILYPDIQNFNAGINLVSHNFNTGKLWFQVQSSSIWNDITVTRNGTTVYSGCSGDTPQFSARDNLSSPIQYHVKFTNFKGDVVIERDLLAYF